MVPWIKFDFVFSPKINSKCGWRLCEWIGYANKRERCEWWRWIIKHTSKVKNAVLKTFIIQAWLRNKRQPLVCICFPHRWNFINGCFQNQKSTFSLSASKKHRIIINKIKWIYVCLSLIRCYCFDLSVHPYQTADYR